MLFVYVDDILALSPRAKNAIEKITEFYKAKEGGVKPPEIYLGANISKMQLTDGREEWTTSPLAYVKNSLLVVERVLSKDGEGYILNTKVKRPKSKTLSQQQNTNRSLMSPRTNLTLNLLRATCTVDWDPSLGSQDWTN
jgi:hypothetical protein